MNAAFRRTWFVGLLVTLVATHAVAAESPTLNQVSSGDDLPGMIRHLLPAVVNVTTHISAAAPSAANSASDAGTRRALSQQPKKLTGSGFIIDQSGLIVTNYHVIDGAYDITVAFSDGEYVPATVLGAVRICDIAVLKVDVKRQLPVLEWGDSDKLQVGELVFAIGNPLGIGLSVTSGVVSAVNRDIMDTPYDDFIQTDAAINHGNSGGPLFNLDGEVVGVNTALISPTSGSSGLGFAIPANDARVLVAQLIAYGWARPGWLGIKVEQVTQDMANAMGWKQEGSIISSVVDGSPAAQAGLSVGDIILRVGDVTPLDERALMRRIANTPIGVTIKLTVRRDGKDRTVPVKVAEWPRQDWEANNAPTINLRATHPIPPDLGLTLSALTSDVRDRHGLKPEEAGVLVSDVTPGTDVADRGIETGDVILQVQDKPVHSAQDVGAALDDARSQNRQFALLLILPKDADLRGAKFVPVRIASTTPG